MFEDFHDVVPESKRRKLKARKPLTVEEKTDIVFQVLVKLEKQRDISKRYRISQVVVSNLVMKAKRN